MSRLGDNLARWELIVQQVGLPRGQPKIPGANEWLELARDPGDELADRCLVGCRINVPGPNVGSTLD